MFYRFTLSTGPVTRGRPVIVRSGDDVIVLDVCGQTRSTGKKKRRPLTKKLFLNGELTPGTSVFQHRKGKKYEVMGLISLHISLTLKLKINLRTSFKI